MNDFDFSYFCSSCPESRQYREANCFTSYRMERYKQGEYIGYKGESVTELRMVVEGVVLAETILDSGLLLYTRMHTAPYPLGSFALFAKRNYYRVNFKAHEDCTVCVVSRVEIEDQMVRCRRFLRSFMMDITNKLDIFSDHLTLLSQKTLRAKIAYYIFTRSIGNRFKFDRKIGELAIYLCVERPSLSRAISALANEGVISYSNGEGEILNPSRLRDLLE